MFTDNDNIICYDDKMETLNLKIVSMFPDYSIIDQKLPTA